MSSANLLNNFRLNVDQRITHLYGHAHREVTVHGVETMCQARSRNTRNFPKNYGNNLVILSSTRTVNFFLNCKDAILVRHFI